jgi:hypothetical protein
VAIALAALLALVAPAAFAQEATTGLIEGRVQDESGSVLPGVTVTMTNTATNFEKVSVTDANGRWSSPLMQLGPYRVSASLDGFSTLVRDGLTLALGATMNLTLTLQVGQVEQEIVVTAAAPLIESTRTTSKVRIDDAAVEGLPNDGRNFLDFAKLTPGATTVQGPDGEELSITGQKGINNNVMIDGADFNNPFFGEQRGGQRPAFTFNQDAVKEILIITDGAPAEYGRSSGGFVSVVTKSGTNDLKTSFHAFYQDDALSESPQLPAGGREPDFSFDRTQLGFTLGGPIKSDKAFFFLAADAQRKDETKQTNPERIDAEVVDFLESVGLPNENAPIDRTDDGDAYLAKLDFLANEKNLLTLRWAYHYSRQENGTFDVDSWGASANGVETDYAHGATATLLTTISPTLLNEFRGQYAKEWRPRPYEGPQVPGQSRPFPDTAFDFGGGYRVGLPFFLPVEYDDDRIQINNNVSWLKGNHSIKAGIEYNDVTSSQIFIGFANSRYIFSSFDGFRNYVNLGPSYVECNDGTSNTSGDCSGNGGTAGPLLLYLQAAGVGGSSVVEGGTQDIDQTETALFIQDSWQPTANLTLDFGLRWEGLDNPDVLTPPEEVFFGPFIGQTRDTPLGPQTFVSNGLIPDDNSQWQPRLALSWTPKNSTNAVLRFNSGIFNARLPALTLAGTRNTNGSINQNLFRASFFNDFGVTPPAWPNILDVSDAGEPEFPDVTVYNQDWQTPRTWSSALSWEQEFIPDYAFLFKANYAKTDHITRFINRNDAVLGRPWSSGLGDDGSNGVNNITSVESTAKSRYWGLTVGVNKRYSKNFAMQAYYTFSEDKSDDDNERDPFTFRYATLANLDGEFGLSDRHQDHRFNAWFLWTAPYGIDFNTRITYLDNQPLDITPDGTPVSAFPPTERCIPSPGAGNPPCDLDAQVFERNQGDKDNEFFTLDFRLSKNFNAGNWTIQPILDVFNITDSENFLRPSVTNLIFNFDGTVQSGGGSPRTLQLGVRVLN